MFRGLICLLFCWGISGCSSDSDLERTSLKFTCLETQESCSVSLSNAKNFDQSTKPEEFVLRLMQSELPALKPLDFYFSSSHSSIDKDFVVEKAWIAGRDMFMGEHDFTITMQDEVAQLQGTIPVCVTGDSMIWRLHIQALIGGSAYTFFADFHSRSRSHN